jgi:hypothetical protein
MTHCEHSEMATLTGNHCQIPLQLQPRFHCSYNLELRTRTTLLDKQCVERVGHLVEEGHRGALVLNGGGDGEELALLDLALAVHASLKRRVRRGGRRRSGRGRHRLGRCGSWGGAGAETTAKCGCGGDGVRPGEQEGDGTEAWGGRHVARGTGGCPEWLAGLLGNDRWVQP